MQSCDTIVVGAGAAGLATAFWLGRQQPEARIVVVEAMRRCGGWAHTEIVDGYLCEHGPQGIRPDAAFDELVAALDCKREIVPADASANRRWIGRDGRMLAVPGGPLGLLTTRLLSLRGKLRILREGRVPRAADAGDESVAAFVARRFGPEAAQLARTMLSGIFAGDADRLEVATALPQLAALEREHGGVFAGMRARRRAPHTTPVVARPPLVTCRGGMQGLLAGLGKALGDRLTTEASAVAVARDAGGYVVHFADGAAVAAPHVVLACPAHQSARLLADIAPELAQELAAIPFASVANVWLGLRGDRRPPARRGFGFLLDPADDSPVLGVLHCSDVFPQHAPKDRTLLRAMLGGVRHPEALEFDDARLIATAIATVERHWGHAIDVEFRRVGRVRRAIPQYDRGHAARLSRIDRLLERLPGLALRGNSYRGVAVTAQLGSAQVPAFAALSTKAS